MHIVYLYHKRLLNYTIKTKKDYVADHLYISRQFISKWENGNSYPDLDNLVKLSTYYEVSIDELLKENQKLKKKIEENEVKLVSLKENFDTKTPQGRLMMTVFQAFSQFERDLIVERTKEGLESARARGRKGGRPRVDSLKIDKALKLYKSREFSVKEIVEMTGVSRATIYRYLNKNN